MEQIMQSDFGTFIKRRHRRRLRRRRWGDARKAASHARRARGFCDGKKGSKSFGKGKEQKGRGYGKTGYGKQNPGPNMKGSYQKGVGMSKNGTCATCGSAKHCWRECPDRCKRPRAASAARSYSEDNCAVRFPCGLSEIYASDKEKS